MLDLVDEFRAMVEALEPARIEFAVCGGLAVAIHAQPRATMDIDLLLRSEAVEATRNVIRELGYILLVTAELESVWAGRERLGWEHGELPVVSREGPDPDQAIARERSGSR